MVIFDQDSVKNLLVTGVNQMGNSNQIEKPHYSLSYSLCTVLILFENI